MRRRSIWNSAETRFYVKGRELFGLHQAKRAIAQSGYALLVEGNFDVITLHGAGFAEAVAPMGTALTDDQARLLKRYAGKVLVAFDGDGAGQKAAVRALEPLERAGVEAHFVGFAPGDDPDSCLQSGGPEAAAGTDRGGGTARALGLRARVAAGRA